MWARSVASSMFWYEIQLRPWQAISWPSSRNAATASGLRLSAIATPNTVSGSLRSSNMRSRRHSPAREPYSYSDSMLMWRIGKACAPMISDRKVSDAGSPCSTLFSPPSS